MLETRITQPSGELQKVRWGWWHLARLADAMASETETSVDDVRWFPEEFTFEKRHEFLDEEDGEIFIIEPGSVYRTNR